MLAIDCNADIFVSLERKSHDYGAASHAGWQINLPTQFDKIFRAGLIADSAASFDTRRLGWQRLTRSDAMDDLSAN